MSNVSVVSTIINMKMLKTTLHHYKLQIPEMIAELCVYAD